VQLRIQPVPYTDAVARDLVAAALADLSGRYGGEGDATPIDDGDFTPPDGVFLVGWRDGVPVGCAGWRSHGDGVAELKRMFTMPAARGTGVARRMLAAIETNARDAGRHTIILETGGLQPEAISLYETSGYRRIANYGFYADEPDCQSYGRTL